MDWVGRRRRLGNSRGLTSGAAERGGVERSLFCIPYDFDTSDEKVSHIVEKKKSFQLSAVSSEWVFAFKIQSWKTPLR